MRILSLLTFLILFQSCDTGTKRKREIAFVKDSINYILAGIKVDMDFAEQRNKKTWEPNLDSVQKVLDHITNDSAELGLDYIKKFEILFNEKSDSINKTYQITINEQNQKKIDSLNAVLSKLKSKFTYKKDEFNNTGFYKHKRWGKYWPNRKTLTSYVNSNGYAFFVSNYSGDDWLFHTSISVLIDEKKFTSENVPSFSDNNLTDHDSGRVWEVITYLESDLILKEIAENTDKTIKVRFNGREFYDDTTLSSADKQALSDCYNLAKTINSLDKFK